MSNAIKKLHDYLAMSPSVVYPEDVLAYLPAIEDENAKLRLQIHWLKKGDVYAYEAGYHNGATNYELDHCPSCKNIADLQDALDENAKLRELVRHLYEYRQLYFKTGIYPTDHGVTERRMRELGVME